MPDDRGARLAANEARFREINERVERDLEPLADSRHERLPFVCECARPDCAATITLSLAEYERVRSDARRFVVLPGHELSDIEDVVQVTDRYAVVRKHPETWELVESADPRR
jgi:hypothetical protein